MTGDCAIGSESVWAGWPQALRHLLIAVAYLVLLIFLNRATVAFEIEPGISVWYIPAGLSLFVLLVFGMRYVPVVAVGTLINGLSVYRLPVSLPASIGAALTIAVVYGLGAALMRRTIDLEQGLGRVRDMTLFISVSAASALAVAVISVAIYRAASPGTYGQTTYAQGVLDWWVGDFIGIITIAPFLLVHVAPRIRSTTFGHAARTRGRWGWSGAAGMTVPALQTLAIIAALWLVFSLAPTYDLDIAYVPFLPLAWIALVYGLPGVTVGILATSCGVMAAIHVFDAQPLADLGELQILMLGLAATNLFLGVGISEREQAEQKVGLERQRAQTYLDVAGVMMVVIERDQTVSLVNKKACEVLGHGPAEIMGKNWFDVFLPERERRKARAVFGKLMAGDVKAAEYAENAVVAAGCEERIIAWHNTVLKDEECRIVRTLSSGEDITDRKRTEHDLKLTQTVVDLAADKVYWVRRDGTIGYANDKTCEALGYTRGELLAMKAADIDPRFQRESFERLWAEAKAQQTALIESVHKTKSGRTYPVEMRLTYVGLAGDEYVFVGARDITERRQAQARIETALDEISRLKEQLEAENIYLRREIRRARTHGDLVYESESMRRVIIQAEEVAGTDSTVLILGETGTGKERLARVIHDMSARKDGPFVIVNCAAMPATLVESELFGHEKGAYTDAAARRIGRFEVADGGTIFLDEIGELPAETQAKLLRVLQDGQFERLGGTETVTADVRVIAATNRDLDREVKEGKFRDDLFYRLNVFPLRVPPLRDRKEDISPLVRTFVEEFNSRMGKRIEQISGRSMDALRQYRWPGNVRELRNVIERAMIQAQGEVLHIPVPLLTAVPVCATRTLAEVERDYILMVLTETGWRVWGKGGAAEILGLRPSTLESRMKRLGVERPR